MTPDIYLWLTPLLVLPIVALVRFIGCGLIVHPDSPAAPRELVTRPFDHRIELTWLASGIADRFRVEWGTKKGGPYSETDFVPVGTQTFTADKLSDDTPLPNGVRFFFRIKTEGSDGNSPFSAEASDVAGITPFIQSQTFPTATRNDWQGWLGMAIQMGSAPILVTQIGRIKLPFNAGVHELKIVEGIANNAIVDLGASVSLDLNGAVAEPDGFVYVPFVNPIELLPQRIYYVLSHEVTGGDESYGDTLGSLHTIVQTSDVASVIGPAFFQDADPASGYRVGLAPNETFGPVNFRY
jgi:hypothetical protein